MVVKDLRELSGDVLSGEGGRPRGACCIRSKFDLVDEFLQGQFDGSRIVGRNNPVALLVAADIQTK
jgi:hypothetical protein